MRDLLPRKESRKAAAAVFKDPYSPFSFSHLLNARLASQRIWNPSWFSSWYSSHHSSLLKVCIVFFLFLCPLIFTELKIGEDSVDEMMRERRMPYYYPIRQYNKRTPFFFPTSFWNRRISLYPTDDDESGEGKSDDILKACLKRTSFLEFERDRRVLYYYPSFGRAYNRRSDDSDELMDKKKKRGIPYYYPFAGKSTMNTIYVIKHFKQL